MSEVGRRGPVDIRLVRLIPGLRRHLFIVGAIAAVTAIAVVVQAEVLAAGLTDLVQDGDVAGGLGRLVLLLAGVAVTRAAAAGATEWSAARAMQATRQTVATAVLDHAIADGDRTSTGHAHREATIATTGVDELEPYIRQFLPALMLAVTVPLAAGIRILATDLLSAVLIAVTVPLIPIFMVLIGQMTERRTQRQWAVLQRLGGHFLDVVEGLPTLRLFDRAEAQRDSVHEVSEQYRATTMGALRIAFLSAFALELIATLSVALIAVEIGLRLASGGLGLATALVVLLLAPECYLPLRRVGASFHAAQSGLDAAGDLHRLLDRPTLPLGRATAPTGGTLRLRGVDLIRSRRTVIADVDLDVAPGSIVAVYGPTGAGKSTLIEACRGRVLDRGGAITVDGVDVRDLDPGSWADRLAVIGQRLTPLARYVIDDVRGGSDAPDELIAAALDDVGLGGFLDRRTDALSGGQLRRVQVARSLVAVRVGRAHFVLADEPTAHLDADSARLVWKAIASLAIEHGAGVLVATHDDRCRRIADHVLELGAPSPVPDGEERFAAQLDRTGEMLVTLVAPTSGTDHVATDPLGHQDRRAGSADTPGHRELWRATRKIMDMARPVRRRFVGATVLGAAAEACTLGLAAVAAWLIVKASEQPDLAELSVAILGVRAFGIGKGVFRYTERLATHDSGLRALSQIRAAVVDRLAAIAPAGIPGWERGDVVQRVVNDVDRLLDLFVRALGPILAVALTTIVAAFVTLLLDPAAGLVLVAALVLVGLAIPALTVAREATIGPRLADARARLVSSVLGYTESVDSLFAARMDVTALGRIEQAHAELDRLAARRARVRIMGSAAVAAAPLVAVIATLATVAPSAASISGPVLGVLVLWPLAVIELVGTVNETAATLPSVAGSAQRVISVLDTPDPTTVVCDPIDIGPTPELTVDALTARWPNVAHDALGPVSLQLPFGSHMTVVGPSGSGKSTLAAVLVGFLPPHHGTYRIDGVDAPAVDGASLRQRITWIQQLPWLADSTVRENLRIADASADDAALVAALDAVRLDTWLRHLPNGLDSRIGRGGSGMSGGEAQRLALARVLLADHRAVVLDEPTANLDAVTAELVLATVLTRCSDRTTVVLDHGDDGQATG